MPRLFFKKQHQVEALIYDYLEYLQTSKKHFSEAINTCLETGVCSDFDFQIRLTHKFESKADDVREKIKELMYGKALLPESRGDIMGLLEDMDKVPRLFELVLHMIKTQKLVIPDFISPHIQELLEISFENCELMIKQVKTLFERAKGIRSLVSTIDFNESRCDHIERGIITKIFDSDLDPFQKLQLKEMVVNMGEISDQTDRISKRVNIISMKRRV
jgi:predicted phosphate transport protein (TIGR00153 family)